MSGGGMRSLRGRRPSFVATIVLSIVLPGRAGALVWPDTEARIERDMTASDAATRRAAARELGTLGRARGTPLTLAGLGDPDEEVRLSAAEAAIRLRAQAATDIVVNWLNAPDVRLRREACAVARALPNLRAVAPLARTLGDPDADVRSAAADALGDQRSADAVAPLLGRLDDSTPAVRIALVAALAHLGDPRAVVPLVGKIEDSSAEVRQTVARALGDLEDPRASPALVLALRDQSADVRRESLIALGRLRATDAIDAIATFVSDRTPSLRVAALEALGRMPTPDALRVLTAALGTADDASPSQERTAVRDALVTAGDAAIPALHAWLSGSPSAASAASAAWVLGALHARSEADTVVGAMRRGELPAAAALHALAGVGTSAQLPIVLEFVTDASPAVRTEAIAATLALLDPHSPDGRAVEPLAAALRDPRPSSEQRARIVEALGRTGAPRVAPLLAQMVGGVDARLRLAAIDALGHVRAEGADAVLIQALGSPEAEVRLHAAIALSETGGATARDSLFAKLDGSDEIDQDAVLTALGGVLARAPTEPAVAKLSSMLGLAAGADRDAILEAIGRTRLESASRALASAARSEEPLDRAAAATQCAAQAGGPGEAVALATARALLDDVDTRVRAQAAWSLGTIGGQADVARLRSLIRLADVGGAANATAALARIARRTHLRETAELVCPLVGDARAWVRANALAGLALADARCPEGSAERAALTEDSSEEVRAAAALAVARRATAADLRALDRCAHEDVSGAVAVRCKSAPLAPSSIANAVLVYIVPDHADAPRPGAPYALLLADGLIRAGSADRRGAVFDPAAPEGSLQLVALARSAR
jgi:HEAT repeat protein